MYWRLFTSRPVFEDESMSCIVNDMGLFFIDKEYRDTGLKEGWLVRIGYHRDEKNRLVWQFRHIRRKVTGQ